jgi:hypothetical protein
MAGSEANATDMSTHNASRRGRLYRDWYDGVILLCAGPTKGKGDEQPDFRPFQIEDFHLSMLSRKIMEIAKKQL